jgi:hypothetical protein
MTRLPLMPNMRSYQALILAAGRAHVRRTGRSHRSQALTPSQAPYECGSSWLDNRPCFLFVYLLAVLGWPAFLT